MTGVDDRVDPRHRLARRRVAIRRWEKTGASEGVAWHHEMDAEYVPRRSVDKYKPSASPVARGGLLPVVAPRSHARAGNLARRL